MSREKWDRNRSILAPGEIVITLHESPVSLQASRKKKDIITSAIREITSKFEFILTDDVQIDIEWWIHEQDRYESDSSADVDNIVKPILDALSGPSGILVDDCQVQSIRCGWLDFFSADQKVNIVVRLLEPDAWLLKEGFVFVHMWNGLCYPTWIDAEHPERTLSILEQIEKMHIWRDETLERTGDYYLARGLMSVQRIFHISRTKDFDSFSINEIKDKLKLMMAD